MSVMRTFLAIDLPEPIRRRTVKLISSLQHAGVRLRWSSPETLHLTLCFLGDIEDRRIPDACNAIKRVAESAEPYEIEMTGVGAFPKLDRARVLWAGVRDGADALITMQREMRMALEDEAFTLDRGKYHPHVTLGRAPQGRVDSTLKLLIEPFLESELGRFPVTQLTLFNSHLDRGGPIHTVLGQFPLG